MKNRKFWVSLLAGIMAAIMILTLILGILPTGAKAATSSEIKNQIESMEKEQKQMQAQIDELKSQQKENLSEIQDISTQKSLIEQQVGLLHEQIDSMNEQIAAYALLIADKQDELDEAQMRLAQLNEKNKARIRAMEEDGAVSYWSVLFQANSFSDFLDRLNMIEEIAASDKRRLDEMAAAAKEVSEAKEVLQAEKAALEASKADLAAKQAELAAQQAEAQALLEQLLAKGAEFDAMMDEQEQILSEMEKDIHAKEEEYDKVKYQEWLATSVPPTTVAPSYSGGGTGGAAMKQPDGLTWLVPCNYRMVSSPFGWRIHPIHGDRRFHAGVDLAVGCTPIYATRAGIVETAQYSSSAGYYVVIDHMDGYKSTYMHMCRFPDVKVGDMVGAGQVIGCVGSTGWSTGPHLHFGISWQGVAMNPMDYIG